MIIISWDVDKRKGGVVNIQAEEVNDYLSAINYFVPVDAFVTIGSAWLLAVVPWVVSQFAISGVKILGEWIPFT